ncbi:MAG: peptidase M23, partial [Niabella sp. SCN 42-15]
PTELKPDIVANMGELRSNHWHMGLDVRTNQVVNQRVVAAADGYVAFVGIKPLSFGRWIVINHPNGLSTLYGHLNTFEPRLEAYVTEQQYKNESWQAELEIPAGLFPVKKGDFISYSGTTGGSQGPHVHWEIFDTKSGRRLNPSLFVNHIADNIDPTIVRMAMYDRGNSTFDQSPQLIKLSKAGGVYGVPGGTISTNLNKLSFAIQAYDTRNGTSNQDGIYSARLFLDGREVSSFYIDSVDYDATRYMNCHVDYKMKANGGAWVQHVQKLPGDRGGVYYDLGANAIINLYDTLLHNVKIIVGDASGNNSTINFNVKNNGDNAPVARGYEWQPNQLNRVFKYDFEAYLPIYTLYDRMNSGYSRKPGTASNSVSGVHKLGENNLPAHTVFEVRIKPDKTISFENKNKVVVKRTGSRSEVRKAAWSGEWMTAQFRDFGNFEAFIDNVAPTIPSLGSGEVVNLNKASRITFTPTDNFGIADFRAEVNGKWLRFTNDKGRTWVYNFDSRVPAGVHDLTVTVTDIAGNKTTRSWKFSRGVTYTPPIAETTKYNSEGEDDEDPVTKPVVAKKALSPTKTTAKKTTAPAKQAATKKVADSKKVADKKTVAKKAATKPVAGSNAKTIATKKEPVKKAAPKKKN